MTALDASDARGGTSHSVAAPWAGKASCGESPGGDAEYRRPDEDRGNQHDAAAVGHVGGGAVPLGDREPVAPPTDPLVEVVE